MAADDATSVEARLDHLLSLWQAHAARGRDVPADELCTDSPALAGELERRIRVIRAVNAMAGSYPDDARAHKTVQLSGHEASTIAGTGEVLGPSRAGRSEAPLPEVPGYEVLSELGSGGMGVVYLARQTKLNRKVALKMVSGVATERRFLHEAELVARLCHPNIVQVYDYGTAAGRPYFAQEYLEGGSLADRWGAKPQPPREAARLAQVLARAVQAAHEQGVIHRDLKPQNILLAADGTPKVADFGLAKGSDSALTLSGAVLGTPSYMAPEQASGGSRRVGPAVDVYALGAVLYQALTGRPPFRGTTAWETLQQVIHIDPVPPARLQPNVPRDLETVCLKCLTKEPARRYATALELADELGRFLAGESVRARPVGATRRAWRWCRRNPSLAAAMALVATSMVGGTTAATVFALSADAQRRAAETARAGEAAARLAAQRQLIDLSASTGLLAAQQNDQDRALLWFARAAALAGGDPDRERLNRVRCGNWARRMLRPVRVLEVPGFRPARDAFGAFDPHPDGRHLLVRTASGAGGVWDLAGGAARPLPGGRPPAAAVWSPQGDRLAVVTDVGPAEVYAFPSLERVQTVDGAGGARILAFSPDGRFLAWGGPDGARVWDCRGAACATPPLPHPRPVIGLRFSAGGDRLATSCEDESARVFAVPADEATPVFPPVPHRARTRADLPPTFTGGDTVLLTAAGDAVIWRSAANGKRIRSVPAPPRSFDPTALVSHPDGRRVALVWDYGLRLWDSIAGRELGVATLPQLIVDAAFAPDGETLVTAGGDTTARLWSADPANPLAPTAYPLRHPSPLLRAGFTADGLLISAQSDGHMCLWAMPPGDPVVYRPAAGGATRVAPSPDGKHIALAGVSQRAGTLNKTRVYDVMSGQPAGPVLDPRGVITAATFSPDGAIVATASSTGNDPEARERVMFVPEGGSRGVQLWDWRTGKRRGSPIPTPTEPRGLAFSPDGRRLAVVCADGWVLLIDPEAGRALHRLDTGVRSRPYTPNLWIANGEARFSPDGRRLATWEMDVTIQLWDAVTGRKLSTLKHDERPWDATFDPDGRRLAVAAYSKAHVWEIETGQPACPPLPHPQAVTYIRFTDGGTRLLAACGDGSVGRWDWRTGRLIEANRHHATSIHDVAQTADGRWQLTVATGSTGLFDRRTGDPAAPPLLPGLTGLSIHVPPDGSRAVVAGFGGTAFGLDLAALTSPATAPAADLVRVAELLSGSRIEEAGDVVPLSPAEWDERWEWYQARHHDETRPPPG